MANSRTFYAGMQVAFKKTGTSQTTGVLPLACSGVNDGTCTTLNPTANSGVADLWEVPRGVQSVGVTTNYNLEQVFQLGQNDIYENIETLPDVEVTVERLLDGTMPLYLIASDSSQDGTLNGRNSSYKTDIALSIYPDTQSFASGTARGHILASGMFLSSYTLTFPVDGNATESVTFVGNDKFWNASAPTAGSAPDTMFPSGVHIATEDPTVNVGNLTGVVRREDIDLANSLLPNAIPGVTSNTWSGTSGESLQTVTISFDLGREEIFRLGQKAPFFRFATFPVEVSCAIEAVTREGDFIEADSTKDNLVNEKIKIVTKGGLTVDLLSSNKLQSVAQTGGDAGGGNVSITYNFVNQNGFTLSHTAYPNT